MGTQKFVLVGKGNKGKAHRHKPKQRKPLPVMQPTLFNNKGTKKVNDDDKKAQELAAKIRHHNDLYWVKHKPEISDPEYDKLVEELRSIEPFHPVLSEMVEDSVAIADRGKISHAVPMLSLEKVFTAEEVLKWANGAKAFDNSPKGLVASYKVDGSSCSLMYEDGKLKYAATRGNGEEGDDITPNALVISGVPKEIPSKKKIEVRGEVYMSIASFEEALEKFDKLVAEGKEKKEDRPVNPRNYCAGSLKQKDASITRERKLSFMAHNVVLHEASNKDSEADLMEAMQKLGFETPFYAVVKSPDDVAKCVADIGTNRKKLPYETDGIVFGINRLATHAELGATGHHPKYRIAFKFAREQGETTVDAINWETSRNGRVMPVVQVKPIFLGGATVTFCTAHHAKNIKDLKLAPGDKILLEREVIPYLVQKTATGQGKDVAALLKNCPSCNEVLEWDETETHLICPNQGGCPAQLLDYMCHYVSRKVCNVMGVGETLIEKLLAAKLIKGPADLFRLTEKDITDKLERQGESSAKNIVAAIQERKEQTLGTFLQSLGIPHLGETVSHLIADEFKELDKVLNASESDLKKVEKMGDKKTKIIMDGLKANSERIKDLLQVVTIKKVQKVVGPLTGKSFCLTGHVEFEFEGKTYDSRPDIEELIESKGGAVKSVSKSLSFLVAGDGAGDKLDKAKKANVKVIDGPALAKML